MMTLSFPPMRVAVSNVAKRPGLVRWRRNDAAARLRSCPGRLAFEHPLYCLYCALAMGVIASPSVKAAAMVKSCRW